MYIYLYIIYLSIYSLNDEYKDSIYACMYICIYIYVYIYMYVCICIYIYIHIVTLYAFIYENVRKYK